MDVNDRAGELTALEMEEAGVAGGSRLGDVIVLTGILLLVDVEWPEELLGARLLGGAWIDVVPVVRLGLETGLAKRGPPDFPAVPLAGLQGLLNLKYFKINLGHPEIVFSIVLYLDV